MCSSFFFHLLRKIANPKLITWFNVASENAGVVLPPKQTKPWQNLKTRRQTQANPDSVAE